MARSTLYHSLVPDMTLVDSTKQQSLLEHFSNQHIISDGLPIYRKLQQDDQDSVRLLTVEDLIVIAKRLSPVEVKEQLLRQIKQSIGDKSWRVRYMAAEHFNEVRQWIYKERHCTDDEAACGSRWHRDCSGGAHRTICSASKG